MMSHAHQTVSLLLLLAAVSTCAAGSSLRFRGSFLGDGAAYRPVLFMHGLTGNHTNIQYIEQWLAQERPGQELKAVPLFENKDSFHNLWEQAMTIAKWIDEQGYNKIEGGFDLLCHSQGALLCRVILETARLNVHTFVSMAGPQLGVFGEVSIGHIHPIFPKVTTAEAYLLFYRDFIAKRCSFCQYWNDPKHHKQYLSGNKFLPVVNGEKSTDRIQQFKENFLSIKRAVFLGSPADETIIPWQSSQWGFYDESAKNIVPMHDQVVYREDLFGLRTLDEGGRLVVEQVEGVKHKDWLLVKDVFVKNVIKYLD